MFEQLETLPADPILGLMALHKNDANPRKVDLGVGVYRDDSGNTPVLEAVKQAEARVLAAQTSKVYVGPAGNESFNDGMATLLLGAGSPVLRDARATFLQTPGGCGALRVAAELIKTARPGATLWVSDPTWGNHIPLLGNAGVRIRTYPYYDAATHGLNFDAMLACLAQVPAGDLVLLHAACHNPTGVDLTRPQWQAIAAQAAERGYTPFIDIAYQGFGEGIEEDAYGLRLLAETLPELVIAASCSKNFGLYRERVGAVGLVAAKPSQALAVRSHFMAIVRGIYSMPPDHGAAIAGEILQNAALTHMWLAELTEMRARIERLRGEFSHIMRASLQSPRFDFVEHQRGMFSFLGLNQHEVSELAKRFGIYMLQSSRMSIAGLSSGSINYVCASIAEICRNVPENR